MQDDENNPFADITPFNFNGEKVKRLISGMPVNTSKQVHGLKTCHFLNFRAMLKYEADKINMRFKTKASTTGRLWIRRIK